jgi:spoIIIJ-associated protein
VGSETQAGVEERVREVLEIIASAFELDAEVRIESAEDEVRAEFVGEDVAAVIGTQGTTLDAIQHLAYRIAYRGESARGRVTVDAGGYRERRSETLRAVADQAAEAAIRDGKPVALEPMTSVERKVVHEHLKGRFDVETYSEGEEPSRRLVVAPLVG